MFGGRISTPTKAPEDTSTEIVQIPITVETWVLAQAQKKDCFNNSCSKFQEHDVEQEFVCMSCQKHRWMYFWFSITSDFME